MRLPARRTRLTNASSRLQATPDLSRRRFAAFGAPLLVLGAGLLAVGCGPVLPGSLAVPLDKIQQKIDARFPRRFPLAGFVIAETLPGPERLEDWCNAALAALRTAQTESLTPDDLAERLEALPAPEGEGPPEAMQLWREGRPAEPCDAATPEAVLDRMFSCSGSSSP